MLRLTCPKHPPGDAETSQSKTSGSVVTTQEIVHALLKNIHENSNTLDKMSRCGSELINLVLGFSYSLSGTFSLNIGL